VGTRVGGIPEMVVDRETGILVPPSDPARLATAIGQLADDAGRRCDMSEAARRRATETFGLAVHGSRLQAAYDGLCATAPAAAGAVA